MLYFPLAERTVKMSVLSLLGAAYIDREDFLACHFELCVSSHCQMGRTKHLQMGLLYQMDCEVASFVTVSVIM